MYRTLRLHTTSHWLPSRVNPPDSLCDLCTHDCLCEVHSAIAGPGNFGGSIRRGSRTTCPVSPDDLAFLGDMPYVRDWSESMVSYLFGSGFATQVWLILALFAIQPKLS